MKQTSKRKNVDRVRIRPHKPQIRSENKDNEKANI